MSCWGYLFNSEVEPVTGINHAARIGIVVSDLAVLGEGYSNLCRGEIWVLRLTKKMENVQAIRGSIRSVITNGS